MNEVIQFFVANGYVLEILLSILLFVWWMDRRSRFVLRGLGAAAVLFFVSIVWSFLPFENTLTVSLKFISYFILCTLGVWGCCEVAAGQAVFYVTAAGAAQHFCYKASSTLLMLTWRYEESSKILMRAGYPLLFVLFAIFCHFAFGKKLRKENIDYLTSSPMILFLLIGMQLCTNILQNFLNGYTVGYEAYTVFNLFDIVCCLFLLTLQCEISRKENEQQNNEILKHILYQQKQQMEISRENIELINIKCHDIKNQIATLGNSVSQDEISELKRAIDIYDTTLKTGNEALDILLVEKLMICENKNIRLDCMARGEDISFMKPSDIYSLFGNAVDNAIEAVDRIEDPEKRCISIRVREEKGMLMIHFENFHEGELSFDHGLPRTTKKDERYHGFGMKSIRMITEKYGGYFSVKTEEGIFTLNILMPMGKKVCAKTGGRLECTK